MIKFLASDKNQVKHNNLKTCWLSVFILHIYQNRRLMFLEFKTCERKELTIVEYEAIWKLKPFD
jgi:hypothetical protein